MVFHSLDPASLKVLPAPASLPRACIQVCRRQSFALAGTQISDEETDSAITGMVMVKGFATIDNVALINVEGTGMVGVVGTASSIFTTVKDAGVNVIMISQASSEHSVCFAVKQAEAERAVLALNTSCALSIKTQVNDWAYVRCCCATDGNWPFAMHATIPTAMVHCMQSCWLICGLLSGLPLAFTMCMAAHVCISLAMEL